jgi:hypothetical protein
MKFEIRDLGLELWEAPSSFRDFSVEIGLKMGPVPVSPIFLTFTGSTG